MLKPVTPPAPVGVHLGALEWSALGGAVLGSQDRLTGANSTYRIISVFSRILKASANMCPTYADKTNRALMSYTGQRHAGSNTLPTLARPEKSIGRAYT